MKTLKLAHAWSFVSPVKTIDYPKGEHEVTDDIYAKAVADGAIKEEGDGRGSAKAGASSATDAA